MGDRNQKSLRSQQHSLLFEETLVSDKPFGMRVHKATQKIVFVNPSGASVNWAFVGDTILSIDFTEIHDSKSLQRVMSRPTTKAFVKIRRNAYSHSQRVHSTVETLTMKRETKLLRAVDVYRVCFHVADLMLSDENDFLGLSVAYDARERLQVASTKCWSLAAIHLCPGDTIKEVNGHPVASKSMLRYWMSESMEKNGFVELLVQSSGDQSYAYDYELEMPEDVLAITAKQIEVHRTVSSEQVSGMRTILRKGLPLPKQQISLTICDNITELPIGSDCDPKSLRKVKKENIGSCEKEIIGSFEKDGNGLEKIGKG